MKIYVITDIHSNFVALKKIYNVIKNDNVDKIIFLGDYLTDCPYPNKTMKLLFKIKNNYDTVFLKGNREDYLENINKINGVINSTVGSVYYTRKHTKKMYLDFLLSTSNSYLYAKTGYPEILFAHGTVNNNRELLNYGSDITNEYLRSMPYKYYVVGHSHRIIDYSFDNKRLFNPGALGICEKDNPNANYLVIEEDNFDYNFEFRSISYSKIILRNSFLFSTLPFYGKTYTRCIRDSFKTYDNIAYKVIRLGNEYKGINEIKEIYYKKAYKEIKKGIKQQN